MKYDKLVRDRIPQIIADQGKEAITHIASKNEFESKLLEKLSEEIAEIQTDASLEELADLLEVIQAICDLKGYDLNEIEAIRQKKHRERGGFSEKIILDEVKD